jgi:EAL domain-containing protein (putative c-di-GMP-specific phosphodiesterase class I)
VLRTACAQNKAWQDAGLAPIVVSVNVSPRQFREADLVETVAEVLTETGLEARYLELELTENLVMHDAPQLVAMLDELKRLGVQIAVDDFGTGYSSLSYLKRFPVDRLKVDRSFVEDIAADADDAAIVHAIIALGHNLGMRVVAEGVESEGQLCFLRMNDCDEAQGFLISRPVSARNLPRLLSRLHDRQYDDCDQQQSGDLVKEPVPALGVRVMAGSQCQHQPIAPDVIANQQGNQYELDAQPAGVQVRGRRRDHR